MNGAESLGKTLKRLKRYEEAAKAFQLAADRYEKQQNGLKAAWMYDWKGSCYRETGDDEAAANAYREAVRRFQELKHNEGLAINAKYLGKTLKRLERYKEAAKIFQIAADAYEAQQDRVNSAWMYDWQGSCHREAADDEAAVQSYAEAVKRFQELKHNEGLALNADYLGNALKRLKRHEEAVEQFQLAAGAYKALGRPADAADAYSEQGKSFRNLEQYDSAAASFKEAIGLYTAADQQVDAAWMCGWRGDCHRDAGDDEAAARAYENAVKRFQRLQHNEGLAINADNLGRALKQLERYKRAAKTFQVAADAYEAQQDRLSAAWMCSWRGDCYRDASDDGTAVRSYTEAVRRFQQLNDNEGLAVNASELGEALERLKRYEEAAKIFRLAADAYETQQDPVNVGLMYSWQGSCYRETGDHGAAASAYAEAVNRFQQLKLNAGLALNANYLGKALKRLKRYEEAAKTFQLAADAYESEQDEVNVALMYNWQGSCHRDAGKNDAAIMAYAEAVDRFQQLNHNQGLALNASHLGQTLMGLGRFPDAVEAFTTAAGAREVISGATHWKTIDARQEIVDARRQATLTGGERQQLAKADKLNQRVVKLQEKEGNYAVAVAMAEEVVDIRGAILGEKHPHYATSLNNLAYVYLLMGQYGRAEPLYRQSLEIRKNVLGEDHPTYALSLMNLAVLLQLRSHGAGALPLQRAAVQIYARHVERTAAALTEQQQIAFAQMFRHCLDWYLTSLREPHRPNSGAFGQVLRWKGSTLVRQRRARLAVDEPEIAPLFAQLQETTRRWARLATAVPKPEQVAQFRHQREALQEQRQRLEVELSRQSAGYREAVRQTTVDDLLNSLPPNAALVDYLEYADYRWVDLPQRGGIGAVLAQSDQGTQIVRIVPEGAAARDGRLKADDLIVAVSGKDEVWETTIGQKLSDVISKITGPAESQVQVRVRRTGHTQPMEITLTRRRLPYQKKREFQSTRSLMAFVVRPEQGVQMFYLGPVAPLSEAIDTWRSSFGMSAASRKAGRVLRQRIWEPLLPALQDAETLLVSPDGVLGRLPLAALPGSSDGTYLLEDHRMAMIPVPQLIPGLVKESETQSQLQRDLLLLGGVDYSASLDRHDKNGEQLQQKPQKPWERGPDDVLALRSIRADRTWNELKGTATEVAFIRDLWSRLYGVGPEAFVDLRGSAATEAAFRRQAPQCRVLHLATHGFFAAPENKSALSTEMVTQADQDRIGRSNPFGERRQQVKGFSPGLLSGLVFAGANNPPALPSNLAQAGDLPDDGIMSADEITFLPLKGVQLVVLSACETGLGEVAGGEGLLGIQRAFQVSGARSTIATLWKVRDNTTRRIMQEFYTNYLEKEMSMLDALREAQLWALHNPNDLPRGLEPIDVDGSLQRTPPYYWAAFVLSGDWK